MAESGDHPPRVLIAGDSVLAEAARPLIFAIEATGQAEADFTLGPDLPRDDADAAVWRAVIERSQPDLVVVSVGRWERLSVLGDFATGGSTDAGDYAAEVLDPFVDLVTGTGAQVLWVGPLTDSDTEVSEFLTALQRDFQVLARRRPEVAFVDSDTWVAPDGFTPTLRVPGGAEVQVRRADGIHLCPVGQALLADGLVRVVADLLDLPPSPGWVEEWSARRAREPGGCAPGFQG